MSNISYNFDRTHDVCQKMLSLIKMLYDHFDLDIEAIQEVKPWIKIVKKSKSKK
jgi:hypothetical protein